MLFILLLVVLIPFITYYITTKKFFRKSSSEVKGKTPPRIPYLLPGISHSSSLAYQGPQKYFAALLQEYGSFSIFSIRLGFRTFVILRQPEHVKKVLASTSSKYTIHERYKYVFGATGPLLKLISGRGLSEEEEKAVDTAQNVLPKKYLTGKSLVPLADAYMSTLSESMHDKMFQSGTWTLIEDFWSFYQQVVTKCLVETLFGAAFLDTYRNFVKDFWRFENAIRDFIPGLPRMLQSTAHVGPRERLLQGIMRWLSETHSGSEFAKLDESDPICDQFLGSKFVQETDDTFSKIEFLDIRARAIEMLVIMHNALINTAYPGYCAMIEILRKPSLTEELKTQIAQYRSSRSGRPDLQGLAKLPIMQSVQIEIARLRLATTAVRHNDGKCQLDDWWTVHGGTYATAFSQDIGLNTDLWAEKDPGVVEKPLKEFWAERFVEKPNESSPTSQTSDRLGSTILALTGDANARLGYEFPQAMQAAASVVFLYEFELQLCDPEGLDAHPTVSSLGKSTNGTNPGVRIRKQA